jgi:ribosome-associated heat shock protein Hsp15
MEASVRIDKFVWAVRLYKTRSLGAEAVKSEQVMLNDAPAKPAATVKAGDEIKVKRNPIWRTYRVKALLKNRVGAKLVDGYLEDITPAAELEKLEMMKLMPGYDREKGKGRPTKRERRELDNLDW